MVKKLGILVVLAALVLASAPSFAEEVTPPIGRERTTGGIAGDIFERRGGYVHPFLSVTEYYTDNVFNTKDNKEDDFVTVLSPGIWFAVPRVKERVMEISTASVAPGGASATRFLERAPGRYQAYALYRADIEIFARNSSENTDNHLAEGVFQYNFRGGLSVDVMNQFAKTHDVRGRATGDDITLDEYNANYFSTILTYKISDRLTLRADYANYLLDYTTDNDNFRDRKDNSASGYIFYRIGPRTSVFGQYEFIDVDYDESTLPSSKQHHVFVGARREVTDKSRIMLKAGYGTKDFENSTVGNKDNVLLEAQVQHSFTTKTSVSVIAARRFSESDLRTTQYVLTNSVGVHYRQRVTSKITGSLLLTFADEQYKGDPVTAGGETKQRKDKYYGVGPGVQYRFKEWLSAEARYTFSKRDSNLSFFDYTNNTVALTVTGSF
ncbi:MAG: outer membrane beta-barrel protein [Nitrospirota bacterium]